MKLKTKRLLQQKGWAEEEIIKAQDLLERAEEDDLHFSKILFSSLVVVFIFAHILVAIGLIPIIIALDEWILYIVIAAVAGMLGLIYDFLIKDIAHLKKKHHLLASTIIPFAGLATMIIIVAFTNKLITTLNMAAVLHNPEIMGIIFAVAFILPYFIHSIINRFSQPGKKNFQIMKS